MHFVAEELRRRGIPTRHLHVWDDYDRFRKVPVGVDPSWSEHIGRPLSKVPDPEGCHDSWAEHFKQPLHDALHAMGVDMEEISQTERYEAGHYRDAVLQAVAARDADRGRAGAAPHQGRRPPEPENEQEAEALGRLGRRRGRRAGRHRRPGAVPLQALLPRLRPRHRHAHGVRRRDDRAVLHLRVQRLLRHAPTCPRSSRASWSGRSTGRCAGPSSTSTSSRRAWTTRRPARRSPSATSSSSPSSGCRGRRGSATASSASPASRRCRRPRAAPRPPRTRCASSRRRSCAGSTCAATRKQTFNIDFGAEVVRLYDEWDALGRKAADPDRRDAQVLAHERAVATSTAGVLPTPTKIEPFRQLSSVADITNGDEAQISRIVGAPTRGPRAAARPGVELDARRTATAPRSARPRTSSVSPHSARTSTSGWPSCSTGCRTRSSWSRRPRWSTAYRSWPAAWASTTPPPTRSRPTRRRSSSCSTTCSSTPTAARGSRRSSSPSAPTRVRQLLTPPPA